MKKLVVILLILIALPLIAEDVKSDTVNLELSLSGVEKIELGFANKEVTSWAQPVDNLDYIALDAKTDGTAVLDDSIIVYAKVQSSEPGKVYIKSGGLVGYLDESKQEIISGSELGWEVSITDINDNTSLILNQIFNAGKQDISTEPVFEHEGIVSSAVQIYNASANISTLGNYFDFIDTGTRYWEQNLKLVWSTT